MVLILPDLLNQVAIYWAPGLVTQSGRRDYSAITPIEVACHWRYETLKEYTVANKRLLVTAMVLTMVEVEEGGVLWLTSATYEDAAGTGLAEIPSSIPYNQEIEHVEHHYSIHADEKLYKSFL